MSNPFIMGSDPIVEAANAQVANELYQDHGVTDPVQPPPDRLFIPNPNVQNLTPEQQAVPEFLRPNETASTVEAPNQLMQVPVANATANFKPAPTAASQPPDASQFAIPQSTSAAPQAATGTPDVLNMNGLGGTYTKQQAANNAIATAAAHKATLDEAANAELEDQYKAQQQKMQNMQAEFDSKYKERVYALDDIQKQLAAQDFTAPKLDKDHLWSSMGTGQKILAGIALALGAVGAGGSGKSNMALDVLNKAIDRDIEQQKFNINQDSESKKMKAQNLRDQTSLQSNMLANLRAKFGDDVQAESALRVLMIGKTQAQLAKATAGLEGKVVKQNAVILNQQLEREKMTAMQQLKAQLAQQQLLQSLGSQDYNQMSPAQKALLPKDIREQYEKAAEVSAPGWIGQAPTKEVLGKFIEKQNEYQPAIDGAQRILALTDPNNPKGFSRLSPEDRAKVSTELVALTGALRVPFTGPGAMQLEEFRRLMNTIGDPTKLAAMPSVQRVKLQTVLKKLDTDLETVAANSGFRRRPKVNVPMRSYNK